MRVVANVAVLADRRMFEGKRPLLLRMALVTQKIDRRLLQIPRLLTVRIMAVGTDHLAFFDRMV